MVFWFAPLPSLNNSRQSQLPTRCPVEYFAFQNSSPTLELPASSSLCGNHTPRKFEDVKSNSNSWPPCQTCCGKSPHFRHSEARCAPRNPSFLGLKAKRDSSLRSE